MFVCNLSLLSSLAHTHNPIMEFEDIHAHACALMQGCRDAQMAHKGVLKSCVEFNVTISLPSLLFIGLCYEWLPGVCALLFCAVLFLNIENWFADRKRVIREYKCLEDKIHHSNVFYSKSKRYEEVIMDLSREKMSLDLKSPYIYVK